MLLNPYIVCTYAFIISLLYPLHGISTFPLNVLCFLGILGTKWNEASLGTAYSIFSHAGPFLWVPWVITAESIFLTVLTFVIYAIGMITFYKHPFDYYIDNEPRETNKEIIRIGVVIIKYVVIPIILLLLIYLVMKRR
jgi:hypothetical protein